MSFYESIAFAAEAPLAAAKQPSMLESLIPFVFILVIMYFLVIRPQAKKAREHASLLDNLKAGDEVITSGGIIAKIKSISPDFITLDLGSTTVKVIKESVTKKTAVAEKAGKA